MQNTGTATFAGLEYPDAETVMERFELAADGSGLSTTTRTKTSIRKLLYKLKAQDGQRLWQTLYPSWEGELTRTFIGIDKGTIAEA